MAGTDFLRTFAKRFTNFTHSQQQEFERALLEMQDSKELSSLESSLSLLKRKVDQTLPIPVLTVRATIRGAVIEWDPLPDQRINFYEVDVSTTQNFSTFDTFPTFGIITVLDGLTATTFVRVRGIRKDGTTTPYSEKLGVTPSLFDITTHTQEDFYVNIIGTDPVVVLGGSELDYTPINSNGNSMVWGFISLYADPAVGLFGIDQITGSVVVKVIDTDGISLVAEGTEWLETFGEFHNSFAIGPFILEHPLLGQSLNVRLEVQDTTTLNDGSARAADSTVVWWAHLNVLELGI